MKKFKFRSLTMRIWTTFTLIILVIIFSISLVYVLAYRKISEQAKIQDLKVAHDILLKSKNFTQQNRFDELGNLKGSEHFTYNLNNDGQIIDVNKNKAAVQNQLNINPNDAPIKIKLNPLQQFQNNDHPINPNNYDVEKWMISYIKAGTMNEQQFKASYNNMTFIFVISSIDNNTSGKYYLISYMPDMQDNSILYLMFIIGFIFIAISFVVSKLVANYISKPLKELEAFTLRIAHKDWKAPIKVRSEDEIGRLANSMNHMQNELQHADEEEKLFLQSISHDLKTPVMVIMSHADAIVDGVYIESAEKTAEIIRDEAIGLEKKIKQILYLNTLDYVLENNQENVKINLHKLLLHIINRFEVVNSRIEWNLNLTEAVISGNEDKIKVALENILENGMRYAEEKICVSMEVKNSQVILEIYNDGPNISAEHISHIFDHLYKDKTGNFGLGLAITKKIVDFFNGHIEVLNREKGVSFILKFPVS